MLRSSSTNGNSDESQPEAGSRSDSTTTSWVTRVLREPLLHFLILGTALFVLFSYRAVDEGPSDPAIVVSAGKVEHLAALFTRTWQRPPTREELEGLVDDFVREEAAYREGTALGLDRDDTIIRRRIRQKLDFFAGDLATQLQPSDADLQAYLDEHSSKFRLESKFAFRQVYFDPARHQPDVEGLINDAIAALQDDPSIDARELGDRTLLEFRYVDVAESAVAGLFGEGFAAEMRRVDSDTWSGPIKSAYGLHAVIIDDSIPGRLPELENVRSAVRREWEHDRRQRAMTEYYEGLVRKYEVIVEWPELNGEAQ